MMYCSSCGKIIECDSKFCCYCGKALDLVAEDINTVLGDANDVIFLKNLSKRFFWEKVFRTIAKIVEILGICLGVFFLYEQYQLDEGYVLWIYILRYMVRFSFLWLLLAVMQFCSDVLTCRRTDLMQEDSSKIWLVCKIIILLANIVIVYPFIGVTNATLAGWVLRFAFSGVQEFLFEFRLQLFASFVIVVVNTIVEKKLEVTRNNKSMKGRD